MHPEVELTGRFEEISETADVDGVMLEIKAAFAEEQERILREAYGTAEMLGWVVEKKQISPHIPVWDKMDGKPGLFGRSDFTWHADKNCYICPAEKQLSRGNRKFKKSPTGITKDNTIIYRAAKYDCGNCHLKPRCCPGIHPRKIARSINEDSRNVARAIMKTDVYRQSCKDRKKVEVLFGHLKRAMNFRRLRLRGLSGASDEFLMAATVQNLKKLAQQRYKPPDHRIGAPA